MLRYKRRWSSDDIADADSKDDRLTVVRVAGFEFDQAD